MGTDPCDYVISVALVGSENPAASHTPSSSPPPFFFVLVLRPRPSQQQLLETSLAVTITHYTQSKITPPMSTQVKYEDDDLELYGGQSNHLGVFYRPLSWSTRLSARPD